MPIQGPNIPSSAAGDGSVSFTQVDNGRVQDGNFANGTLIDSTTDVGIRFTNFGFNLPNDAVVTDIKIEILHQLQVDESNQFANVYLIPIQNYLQILIPRTLSLTSVNGSPAAFGNTFTVLQINASTFGFILKWFPVSPRTAGDVYQIDACQMTITYLSGGKEYSTLSVATKSNSSITLRCGRSGM